jgi:protein TonB
MRIRLIGWSLASVIHLTAGMLILRTLPVGDPIANRPAAGQDIIMKVSLIPAANGTRAVSPAPAAAGAAAVLAPEAQAATSSSHGGANAPILAAVAARSPAQPEATETAEAAAPSTVQGAAADQFRDLLLAHIARFRRYPPEAQSAHIEGTVWLRFVMDRAGHVDSVWIDQSSGQRVLDNEAVASIRRADPLPAIPSSLPDRLDLTLPIGFSWN